MKELLSGGLAYLQGRFGRSRLYPEMKGSARSYGLYIGFAQAMKAGSDGFALRV
jgi:hypothetical protein